MSFISKLNHAVEELKQRPDVEVVHYQVLPPVPGAVERVEEALGYSLDESIRSFYAECDGIELLWGYKEDESLETSKQHVPRLIAEFGKLPRNDMFVGDNMCAEAETRGVMMIRGIEAVFLDTELNNEVIDFDVEIDGLEIDGDDVKYRILEFFSNSQNVIFVLDGSSNPRLVAGTSGEYDGERVTTFQGYLDRLLETKGDNGVPRIGEQEDGDDDE